MACRPMARQTLPPSAPPRLALLLVALAACAAPGGHRPSVPPSEAPARSEASAAAPFTASPPIELLGTAELPTGARFGGTEIGGLSGLAYDPGSGRWLALADDRGDVPERGPVRFYEILLAADGGAPPGRVEVVAVTGLTGEEGEPLPAGGVDPEGLALAADGLWIASEGVARDGVPPFVRRFGRDGRQRAELEVPARFVPAPSRGVRDNLGFEALALTPDGRSLIAGTESALVQDGPVAEHRTPAAVRLVVWDLVTGEPVSEHAYEIDPVPWPPAVPGAFRVSGLVELAAFGQGRLLALERAFAVERGRALKLYLVDLDGAADVSGVESLANGSAVRPVRKRLLLDLGAALSARGVALDNLEGMAFGPDLPDGRRLLVVVADNNFRSEQRTLFVALAVGREALDRGAPERSGNPPR